MLKKPLAIALCAFALPTVATLHLHAQANAVDAAVNGYIQDPSGAAVPGASETLTNLHTGVSQTAVADGNGYYRFPLVPVGTYKLTVTANGFSTITQSNLVLNVGQAARLDVKLPLSGNTETVDVKATASVEDAGSATVGTVLSQREVETLPIASRNLFNMLLLSPGVVGIPTSTFSTTQYTFGGNERSQWNLDGLDNSQHGNNRQIRLIIVTPEAVAQTQTLSNGYSAEFGRAAGGQVNVLLKSGTNEFHGSAMGQYRPKDLQAIPTLATKQPNRSWHDEAFTLGGPIIKDRLFFFGQFENNPYTLPNVITITQANATALGLPSSQIGTAPFGETYRTLVGKVNFVLNAKNTGYIRYARFTNQQPNNASGLSIVNRGSRYEDHQNGGGMQLATVLSDNLLNELRVGTVQRDTGNFPVTGASAVTGNAFVNISSVANIGSSSLSTTTGTERASSVVDNLTWTHGRSTFKFGGEFDHTLFSNVNSTAPTFTFSGLAAQNGRAAVPSLNQYLNAVSGATDPATGKAYTYTYLTSYSGNPQIRTAFNFVNLFAQDEFRFSPKLSVNFGARYELILFPTFDAQAPYAASRSVNNDYTDLAPRVAITYTPGPHTVVHAAYGMYYDVPPLNVFYNAGLSNGHRLLSYQVAGTAAGAPVFPNVPDFSGATSFVVKPSITAFDPNFHNTYQHQANLQVQQDLGLNFQLTFGYLFAAQRHGLFTYDTNLTTTGATLADGRPIYGGTTNRPNPNFGAINLLRSGASSNFNGAFAMLQKRMSHGLQFTVNYTYGHALATNIGEGSAISDPSNPGRDYGNADGDVRHNVVIQGIYRPTFSGYSRWLNGFELSSTTFMNSGMPINTIAGTDLNNDGVINDRPLFMARNSRYGRGLQQEDLQVRRIFDIRERFHVAAFAVAENLLNTNNLNCNTTTGCTGSVINTANSGSYLSQTSARTSRNFQVGMSLKF